MEAKTKDKKNRGILIATVVLGVLLILTVAFSIIFFYKRIKDARSILAMDKANTYDSYYVLITGGSA